MVQQARTEIPHKVEEVEAKFQHEREEVRKVVAGAVQERDDGIVKLQKEVAQFETNVLRDDVKAADAIERLDQHAVLLC